MQKTHTTRATDIKGSVHYATSTYCHEQQRDVDADFYTFLPNYRINTEKKINLNEYVPKYNISQNGKKKYVVQSLTEATQIAQSMGPTCEQHIPFVGQFFSLYIPINDSSNLIPQTNTTTYFIMEHKKSLVGVTVFHTNDPSYEENDYTHYFLISPSSLGIDLQSIHLCAKKQFKKHTPHAKIIELLCKKYKLYQVHAIEKALIARKEWIIENRGNPIYSNCFVDASLHMQPHPAIDVMLFYPPQTLIGHLMESVNAAPLKAIYDSIEEDTFFGFLGYQWPNDKKDFIEIYGKTFPKYFAKIVDSSLVHRERISFGIGRIKAYGPLATCYSSTFEGSSGCPILNQDGELIGINTCSYYDIYGQENAVMPDSIYGFDAIVEGNDDKTQQKNFNIFVSVTNAGFQAILDSI